MKPIDEYKLREVLQLLEERLRVTNSETIQLVVCGGSALIATKLVSRTTKDFDIVALIGDQGDLIDPEPLPEKLINAANIVADSLMLPHDWLNCGPSDLFRMGLPEGFLKRVEKCVIGPCLTVYFAGRLDQIHFKLYASVDRGGYHIQDLLALEPSVEELVQAAKWSMTHDVSDGYATILKQMLEALDYAQAAEQI